MLKQSIQYYSTNLNNLSLSGNSIAEQETTISIQRDSDLAYIETTDQSRDDRRGASAGGRAVQKCPRKSGIIFEKNISVYREGKITPISSLSFKCFAVILLNSQSWGIFITPKFNFRNF